MKKLYLVDVSSMYFRAFYAIRPLTNKAGMPTNALYGFLSMAIKLLKEVSPDYMAFCFDRKEPSFRKEMFDGYKANRSEMPEDLVPQVPYIRKLTEALGIPAYDRQGFEADDIIGTLTEYGRKHNLEVVIVSGDKDFAQLVSPFVTMYDTMKEIKYDPAGVIEKWGIEPSQVMDYLSLVGDSSDNIPGVKGIGPKGAQKLLAEYKTLDGIYANLDKIKNVGLKTKLESDKANAYLSKKLVAIKTDIDLGITLDDLKLRPLPEVELKNLLEELDFKSFERRVFGSAKPAPTGAENSVMKESSPQTLSTMMITPPISSSVEELPPLEDSRVHQASPMLSSNSQISMFDLAGSSAAIGEKEIHAGNINEILKPGATVWGFSTDRGLFVGSEQNVYRLTGDLKLLSTQFDKLQLFWKGYDIKEYWHHFVLTKPRCVWDSSLAAYILRAGDVGSFNECYQKFTGAALPDLSAPNQIYAAQINFESILKERLTQVHGDKLYEQFDLPLATVLYQMEQRGILLDVEKLKKQSHKMEIDLRNLEKEIFETTGHTFNLTSPKQLGDVLFNKLKMPVIRKTKTGFSTDSDVLLKLSKDYPVCLKLIEYRELSKLKSTYLDSLPLLVNPEDGRLHTRFYQNVTTTGRLSSMNPNLQNIPIRTPRGAQIREAFIVPKGKSLVSVDYSQIELRILAHITEDPGLTRAFENDLDIHAATAAEVFDIDVQTVTSEQRRIAKAVNFGIAYGMGSYGLAENLSISADEAKDIIKKYFSRFPGIRDYMENTIQTAKKQGYVETIFGRRRYLDELKSNNGNIRKFGERAAINAPMQGTASDIVKKAMLEVDAAFPGLMLLQVHDELILEVEALDAKDIAAKVKEIMENVVSLNVPLKANVAIGDNWDSAQ